MTVKALPANGQPRPSRGHGRVMMRAVKLAIMMMWAVEMVWTVKLAMMMMMWTVNIEMVWTVTLAMTTMEAVAAPSLLILTMRMSRTDHLV